MISRTLGPLEVSSIGLGCMGMSYAYGPTDDAESLRVLHRYLDAGGNFLDTAEIYGPFTNELLLGRFLAEAGRDRVVVATKFGFRFEEGKSTGQPDGSPANVRRACEESLRRLGVETIDLFYQHRMDAATPIEETVSAMAELVGEGKIRAIGLSEASPEILRRAASVHSIAALQSEYSLWTREVEKNGVLETCRALGIGFVAYSPLGRGFLTGTITKRSDLDPTDWRLTNPRFEEAAFDANLKLAEAVKQIASDKGCTPAQLALAWTLAQGEDIIPIPGTKRLKYLEENLGAAEVRFTPEELARIHEALPVGATTGARYKPDGLKIVHN